MRILLVVLLMGTMGMAPKHGCGTSKEATNEVANSPPEAAIDVSAKQLFADYTANEVSADDKYKDKILRVSGTISSIGKDIMDTPFVSLAASDFMGVQCMFDDTGALGSLKKGQKITVRCKGDGKMGNVMLRGCVID